MQKHLPEHTLRRCKKGNRMKNIGTFDRILRALLSLGLLSLFFLLKGGLKWLGLLGFIPLLTAITGVCPLYTTLHLSTRQHG